MHQTAKPSRQRGPQFQPAPRPPPLALDHDALGQHRRAPPGFGPPTILQELFSVPNQRPALLLRFCGHGHDAEGVTVAAQVTLQPVD